MKKLKRQLDKEIQQHKDERIRFTLVDDIMGVIDLDVAAGELFDNLVMVHLDKSIKSKLTLGKIYEYSAAPFKESTEIKPMYMFASGIDPDDDEMFSFEDKPYETIALYAFPAEKLVDWAVKKHANTVMCYELPKDFDIEELKDFLEEVEDTDEAIEWLEEHGAKPHKGE